MNDQEIVALAVAETQAILLEFLEGGEHDPVGTINRLKSVMSEHRVVEAFRRMHGEQVWDKQYAPA